MAVSAVVVTSALATTGDTAFTSSGFGTPDAALIIYSGRTTSATNPNTHASLGVAFWTASAQAGCTFFCNDNAGTTNTYRYADDSVAAPILGTTNNVAVAYTASSTTDGIKLSVTAGSTGLERYATVLLLKGLTNEYVGNVNLGTGTSAINVTDPGFRADLVFLATICGGSSGSVLDIAAISFGAAQIAANDTVAQGSVYFQSADAVGDTNSSSAISDDYAIGQLATTGTLTWQAAVSANASGFAITPNASAGSDLVYYLAIELPDPEDAYVAIKDIATGSGGAAYTGSGFTPQAVILAQTMCTALETVTEQGSIAFGLGGPATSETCIGACDEDAEGTTDAESYVNTTNILQIKDDGGSNEAVAALDSLDSDGWTLAYSDYAASARKMLAIAIGSAGGTTISGTGALASQAAVVSGAGKRVVTGFAELLAGSASISGAGDRIIIATGALAAQAATVAGTGLRTVVGTGALQSGNSDITGSGQLEGVVAGSGALAAGSSTIEGTGTVAGAKTGTGALAAGSAAIAGVGVAYTTITGTGDLAAGSAAIAGSGTVVGATVITGTGAIQCGQATINGVGIRTITGTGALVAGSAAISGRDVAVAGWLCGTPSIYAALSGDPSTSPALTATFSTYPEGCG